jgi:ATP-dependent Clp protease protease subunit
MRLLKKVLIGSVVLVASFTIFLTLLPNTLVPAYGAPITKLPPVSLLRTILINGPIDTATCSQIAITLLELNRKPGDIRIILCTPGGEVTGVYILLDAMDMCTSDIQVIAQGQCSSGGVFILAHGTKGKRLVYPRTKLFIHGVQMMLPPQFLNKRALEKTITDIAEYQNELINCLVKDTGKSADFISKLLDTERYYTAKEVINLNIADGYYKGE